MTPTTGTSTSNGTPDEYDVFLATLRGRVTDVLNAERRVFTTDAEGLFPMYLHHLPMHLVLVHNCYTCRRFLTTYGALVTIDANGRTTPLLWNPDEVPDLYRDSVKALARIVASSKVTGVFFSDAMTWGTPVTGPWTHMAVTPPKELVFGTDSSLRTAEGTSAEKTQDYEMLHRGLAEFPHELCVKAHSLLTNGQLTRSEKHVGMAKWLVDLHAARDAAKGQPAKNNVVWRATATAPAGFCHVRSGMIGTLLEDLASGMDFHVLQRRFNEKMDPLQYQRATAPLSEGNRAQAEKLIADLGVEKSLERRFAKIEDVTAIWKPDFLHIIKAGGIFGHLKTGDKVPATQVLGPAVTMTWDKFLRTVIPDAVGIAYHVPHYPKSYFGMVTAVHPDAPPILQWDLPEKRNPVSWYFYVNGSLPQKWNLAAGTRVKVTAICLQPSAWNGGFEHQGNGAYFLLEGARDVGYERSAGFFTETLRSELHPIRATMEAYMMNAVVEGALEATACGIAIQQGKPSDCVFRVTAKTGIQTDYKIDRWD